MNEDLYLQSDDLISYPYRLTGEKMSDNERHGIARAKLLVFLAEEPRVLACFKSLGDDLGILDACSEATGALEEIAHSLGFHERGEMLLADGLPEEISKQLADALTLFLEEEVFSHQSIITGRLVILVRVSLKLPLPWVAMALFEQFIGDFFYCLLGLEVPKVILSITSSAPNVELIFGARPDESVAEAAERLTRLYLEAMRRLTGSDPSTVLPKRGRSPIGEKNPNGETIARYTDWFIRYKIQGESKHAIAAAEKKDRRLIIYGIEQAEKALGYAALGGAKC